MEFYIIIFFIILITIYVLITYNSLIKTKNRVDEAFSIVDVHLKKRWDLIPNVVESVKGYKKYEKNTLENIIKLRNNSYENMSTNDKVDINNKITQEINKIMVIKEAYPELNASEIFLDLSKKLSKIEDEIANSRKYYNALVRIMNNKVQTFPNNIIAKIFGFKNLKMFEANEEEKESIKVTL